MIFLTSFYIIFAFSQLTVKFINEYGNPITTSSENPNFIIIVNLNDSKIFLNASNHIYSSSIDMFQDPCLFKITGIFSKAMGTFNSCKNELKFVNNKKFYNIKTTKNNDAYFIDPIAYLDNNKYPNDFNIEIASNGLNNKVKNDTIPYKIDIFIFNNSKRVKKYGELINNNTVDIFKEVKSIFKESGLLIEPKLLGILNIKDDINFIDNKSDSLSIFKEIFEPIRFSPYNFDTPLSNSDLILLLNQIDNTVINKELHKIVHGMTFFGGSNRLDASYSVVFTSEVDSIYFIAKKIAHEIGHSLGARHEDQISIMEKTTCKDCENEKRYFSDNSKNQINLFIEKNRNFFSIKKYKKYKEDAVLKTLNEAEEYANERRKHTFKEIIKNRLNDRIPIGVDSDASILLTLFLYTTVIILVIIYWK